MEREWIPVRCHEGHRRRTRPLAITLDGAEHEIRSVLAEWLEQSTGEERFRYYRVLLVTGRAFVIGHELAADRWFLHEVVPGSA